MGKAGALVSEDAPTRTLETSFEGSLGWPESRSSTTDSVTAERRLGGEVVGRRLGRFTLLERLGSGGMGTVFSAYDERLDRRVALKVLHQTRDDERLWREAHAMARLSHPNVVTVHEVGHHEGLLYIVMEFVRGQGLSDWLRDEPPWPEILDAFVQAGRGLAASHEVGLVHRDVKPSNLMRSGDGVVKVIDFGLAREDEALEGSSSSEPSSDSLSSSLTAAGTVMGTPPYMAPEQHQGRAVDPRSDQYAWCTSLWQGLTRQRPFQGGSLSELLGAKLAGVPAWPRSAPPVPRRIVEALERGMAADPDDRWPRMEPLLETLAREMEPRRRGRSWALALAGVALLGSAGLALRAWSEARAQRCSGAQDQLDGIWDEARRARMEAALLDLDVGFAAGVWTRTQGALDEFATAWIRMHAEACEATTIRGEQSDQVLDLRMACLRRSAMGLQATVEVLEGADVSLLAKADDLVAELPNLSRCADVGALTADVEPPLPAEAAAVDAARLGLSRARALLEAGRYEEAGSEVDAAEEALADVEYEPVQTELLLEQARVLMSRADYEEAEARIHDALARASANSRRDVMATAVMMLIDVVGIRREHMAEALMLRSLAEALTRGSPTLEARAHATIAEVLRLGGRLDAAEQEYRKALSLQREVLPATHLDIAWSRVALAELLELRDDYDRAEAEHREVLALLERVLGPEHPKVARQRSYLGACLVRAGRYEEAEVEIRASIEGVKSLGPTFPPMAWYRNQLGGLLERRGRSAEAEVEFRAALQLWSEAPSPEPYRIARARMGIGMAMKSQGRVEEAEVEFRAALKAFGTDFPPDHYYVLWARTSIGRALLELGRFAEAAAEQREVVAAWDGAELYDAKSVASAKVGLYLALLEQGRNDEAERTARQTVSMLEEAIGPDHAETIPSRVDLAILLAQTGRAEAGEQRLREVLLAQRATLDPDDPALVSSRASLGIVLVEAGRHQEAEAELRAVLASPSPDAVLRTEEVRARVGLAASLVGQGRPAEAEPELRTAMELGTEALGIDDELTVLAKARLAHALLELGRTREARALAEEVWDLAHRETTGAYVRGRSTFVAGQVLWELFPSAEERATVRGWIEQIPGWFQGAPPTYAPSVEQWLDEHPPP